MSYEMFARAVPKYRALLAAAREEKVCLMRCLLCSN